MNKKINVLLIALLGMTALVGCDKKTSSDVSSNSNSESSQPAEVELLAITLNKNETNILLGSNETLTATFNPANATNKEVEWSSDKADVATVDDTGKVTAKKVGEANIKVASKKNASIFASCKVTVKDNVVLSSVDAKHEFVLFEQNRSRDDSRDDGFYNHEETYKVGDDNAFNVKPALTVLDATLFTPVSASRWLYDFTITAKLNGEVVGDEYFSVIDARECDIKFTEAAVGKKFAISVAPIYQLIKCSFKKFCASS